MLRAAIFDLDGLLIDSEPLWQEAEVQGFGAVGVSLTHAQAQETLGLRSDEVVRLRHQQYGWDVQHHPLGEVEDDIIRRLIGLIEHRGRAKEGVEHALAFVERKGLRLALASSSRMTIIETALEVMGIAGRFEVVYSAEVEPHGKPHPGVYLSTVSRLSVAAESCVAFEDSLPGLDSAKAAGLKCIVVPERPVRGNPRLERADLVLDSLGDLDEDAWDRL